MSDLNLLGTYMDWGNIDTAHIFIVIIIVGIMSFFYAIFITRRILAYKDVKSKIPRKMLPLDKISGMSKNQYDTVLKEHERGRQLIRQLEPQDPGCGGTFIAPMLNNPKRIYPSVATAYFMTTYTY